MRILGVNLGAPCICVFFFVNVFVPVSKLNVLVLENWSCPWYC